jgi:hypothetical protein
MPNYAETAISHNVGAPAMSLTKVDRPYLRTMVFGRSTIEAAIASVYRGWELVSIYEARRQGQVPWVQLVAPTRTSSVI